ncbi:MAG: hypothetical protein WC510_03915 [Candidatus Omnitrophota bacterium]
MNKRLIAKIAFFAVILALSTASMVCAEDYPSAYLGNGYREYLLGRIQSGYYVDIFTKLDMRYKERVNKRNEVEKIVSSSYQVGPQSEHGILSAEFQQKYNAENIRVEIMTRRQQRIQGASAQSEFNYIKHSDGRTDYFKDGLLMRMENERVVDQFGNVSFKNTFNIKYNEKRLMVSSESTVKDSLGNISTQYWHGAKYSDDSVFYADEKTSAVRNLMAYTLEETDSAGNTRVSNWEALQYDGKFLRAFAQVVEDSVYGISAFVRSNIKYDGDDLSHITSYHEEGIGNDNLFYSLDRTETTYNGAQLLGYHETIYTTQVDGNITKTTVDAQFTYSEFSLFGRDVENESRLLETNISAITENADGSIKTENTVTKYEYDANHNIISASGNSRFSGQEANWYEYTDAAGHILTRNTDENGNITYSYVDTQTAETIAVDAAQVTSTLKEGNKFNGTSNTEFELLFGTPMAKQINVHTSYYGIDTDGIKLTRIEDTTLTYTNGLRGNLLRVLGNQEHTQISNPFIDPDNTHILTRDLNLTYGYDAKGNLVKEGTQTTGTERGWEYAQERGWYNEYIKSITVEYDVILGKALIKTQTQDKLYLHDITVDMQGNLEGN